MILNTLLDYTLIFKYLHTYMKKGLRQFMLILASGSPRRQDLLKQVELNFLTIISNVDESSVTETDPKEKTMTLARLKSHEIVIIEELIFSFSSHLPIYDV